MKRQRNSYCVYRHISATGELLYVGISGAIISRTESHNNSHWFHLIDTIRCVHFSNKSDALDEEKMAIKNEKPKFNLAHSGFINYSQIAKNRVEKMKLKRMMVEV